MMNKEKIRADFPMIQSEFEKGRIYFDSAATSLKPKILSEAISNYYNYYSANAHRGDYDLSYKVDDLIDKTRMLVSKFINCRKEEIVFTNNATDSLNKIISGYFDDYLTEGDEILITKSEHASNVLPWFELKNKKKIKINYIPLNDNFEVEIANVEKNINNNTKVISLALTTNVIGDTRPIKEIISLAHKHNILVIVDGAQAISHNKIDLQNLDIDFFVFSAHKILGPTGLGILFAKKKYLDNIKPLIVGGGMNIDFNSQTKYEYSKTPYRLEAGTPNIASIISFGNIIEYLNKIDIYQLNNYVYSLREYAIKRLKEINNIIIYNENIKTNIIVFNYKEINAHTLAEYLNKNKICIRAGNHCAKMIKEVLNVKDTCRISLYFYNTKEEIDYLIEILKSVN